MELTTLSKVKAYLGVTETADDAYIGDCIEAAEDWIRQYCGRPLGWVSATRTEFFDGMNAAAVVLTYTPVVSLTSVAVWDGGAYSVQDSSGLALDPDTGVLSVRDDRAVRWPGFEPYSQQVSIAPGVIPNESFASGARAVRVIYVGGYSASAVPALLGQAAREMTAAFYYQGRPGGAGSRARDPGMQSENLDRYSYQRATMAETTDRVAAMLAPYRKVTL